MGWLARTWARGALLGALALIAATAAYYVTDAFALQETLAGFESDLVVWWTASVLFGTVLGVVGASIRRPGPVGLLAALTVPVGAALQMILMPPRPHMTMTPAIILAEVTVWTAAAVGAAAGPSTDFGPRGMWSAQGRSARVRAFKP